MRKTIVGTVLGGAMLAGLLCSAGGCHQPGGGLMPFSGASHTLYSTENSLKTFILIDRRTNEAIFTMDIPPGKQFTYDFNAGEGDDPVYTPDLMLYQVDDIGKDFGRLRNSLTVPNAQCRAIEITLRNGIEYADAPQGTALRTDQAADRPDWWTPEGGPMPENKTAEMYDN